MKQPFGRQQFSVEQAERESMLRGPSLDQNPKAEALGCNVAIRFRRFSVVPRARHILADDEPIELGDRAFDLLMALLAAPGTLITKHDLLDHVWPSVVVEEGNLHAQISALRRALGDDRDVIKTVSGRGYMFVGDLVVDALSDAKSALLDQQAAFTVSAPLPNVRSAGDWLGFDGRLPSPQRESPVVAVIDDDSDIRKALGELLKSVGINVELFSSVQEFLDGEHCSLPDCLVLDVRLPGKSGLEFLEELAKMRATVPVIFISGYADVPMSVRAMKAGAFEFLTKPVRHQDLLEAIQRAIGSVSASRSTVEDISGC